MIVTGRSDGAIQLFKISASDLQQKGDRVREVGKLLGTYETGNRITCLDGFVMLPSFGTDHKPESEEFDGFDEEGDDNEIESSSSDSE